MYIWKNNSIFAKDKGSIKRVGNIKYIPTHIVLWCNGSTTGFGPVCGGSSPPGTTAVDVMIRFALWRTSKALIVCEDSKSLFFIVFVQYLFLILKKKSK